MLAHSLSPSPIEERSRHCWLPARCETTSEDDDRVTARANLARSGPQVANLTAARDPGVDGISNTVHPRSALMWTRPLAPSRRTEAGCWFSATRSPAEVRPPAGCTAAELLPPPIVRTRAREKEEPRGHGGASAGSQKRRPDGGGAGQPTSRRCRSRCLRTAAVRRDRCLGRPTTTSLRHRLRRHALDPFRRTRSSSPSTTAAPPSRSLSIGGHLPSILSTAAASFGLPAWHHQLPCLPSDQGRRPSPWACEPCPRIWTARA